LPSLNVFTWPFLCTCGERGREGEKRTQEQDEREKEREKILVSLVIRTLILFDECLTL
jgi:hypothetical protein